MNYTNLGRPIVASKDEELSADFQRNVQSMVDKNVWARTTTGQSISMDHVICEIYKETK